MYPRAILRVRIHAPSALRKARRTDLFHRSCWPAAGITAAFQFAEVGIIRWQLMEINYSNFHAASSAPVSHYGTAQSPIDMKMVVVGNLIIGDGPRRKLM